jgi:hypothetical protein
MARNSLNVNVYDATRRVAPRWVIRAAERFERRPHPA